MIGNIIEIGTNGKKLSVHDGFLQISEDSKCIKDIPLDTILSILITNPTTVYTQPFMQTLAENGIPLITCGKNFVPTGIYLPLIGYYKQGYIQRIQMNTKLTLQKRLWQQVVIEKVKQQAAVLKYCDKKDMLSPLICQITSGDSKNIEAIAAKYYFPLLFGSGFKRDTQAEGINSFLNYGYAVIRACVARFVIATGLLPTLAIKHQNMLNPLCLVDDLMEPFRPLVDLLTYQIFETEDIPIDISLTPQYKKRLSGLLVQKFVTKQGISPVYEIIEHFIRQYVNCLENKEVLLSSGYCLKHV